PAVVVRDQVQLVRDDDPGPEPQARQQGAEALVRGDHDVGGLGRQRVAVFARHDAQANVGPREELLEAVVDLDGKGAEGHEVRVDAGILALDGAAVDLAPYVRLARPRRRDDQRVAVVQDAGADRAVEERETGNGLERAHRRIRWSAAVAKGLRALCDLPAPRPPWALPLRGGATLRL